MINKILNDINISTKDLNEEIINLSSIINIFLRRKSLFLVSLIFLFIFFILQLFYERKFNPVYRGEFKILINDPLNFNDSSLNSSVSGNNPGSFLLGGSQSNNTSSGPLKLGMSTAKLLFILIKLYYLKNL